MSFTRFTHGQMQEAADLGAVLEFDYLSCSPNWHDAVPPAQTAEAIRSVGPEHCVMGTDGGQAFNPHPPVMMRQFAEALRGEGFSEAEIRRMMCENPARLLDL
jgi:predicted metal-dependent phosphotriesterase family hydrolase